MTGQAMDFINITAETAVMLAVIGFVGGLLSGFMGTGGAFIMTPAMMSLGIPGIMAVAANVTHKFGKSIIGAKKHSEMGNVDKKLGFVMFVALFAGVKAAVTLNQGILQKVGVAASNLYISLMFIIVLSVVSAIMLSDILQRIRKPGGKNIRAKLAQKLKVLSLPPLIDFEVAGVRSSLWLVLLVGLATGYLAGTIGVGGFIGVPAMIYLLGINVRVAAGTELFLAIFSGFQGTLLYALNGYVDLRIPLLLYLGSIVGVTLGVLGTRVVKESQIQAVMIFIIIMVVLSRLFTVPGYLAQMGFLKVEPVYFHFLKSASELLLFGGGAAGCGIILWWIFRALTAKGRFVPRH